MPPIGRGVGVVPSLMTIGNQWFVRRKALTMTLLNTAFAGGAAVMVPLLAWCEGEFGWRATILWAGALAALLVVSAALVSAAARRTSACCPTERGPRPAEEQAAAHPAAGALSRPTPRPTSPCGGPWPRPAFWLLTVAVTLRIASADALVINQISMLVWKGIPEEQAAFYLSSTFLAIIPLRFAMGLGAMWVPSRWLLFGGMSVGALGTAAFLLGSGYGAAAMFVVSIAATEGIATLGWLAVGEYFGRRSFGSLVGIMTVCFGVGSLAAPVGGRLDLRPDGHLRGGAAGGCAATGWRGGCATCWRGGRRFRQSSPNRPPSNQVGSLGHLDDPDVGGDGPIPVSIVNAVSDDHGDGILAVDGGQRVGRITGAGNVILFDAVGYFDGDPHRGRVAAPAGAHDKVAFGNPDILSIGNQTILTGLVNRADELRVGALQLALYDDRSPEEQPLAEQGSDATVEQRFQVEASEVGDDSFDTVPDGRRAAPATAGPSGWSGQVSLGLPGVPARTGSAALALPAIPARPRSGVPGRLGVPRTVSARLATVSGRASSSLLSTSARRVAAQWGCVSSIRAKSSMLLMVVIVYLWLLSPISL